MSTTGSTPLLESATTTGGGAICTLNKTGQVQATVQVWGTTSTGTGSASVNVEVRNHSNAPWITLGTLTLALSTTAATDGLAFSAAWMFVRANVTAISGTNASVNAVLGS